tara:strand:+ start:3031 stop:3594 length:564 start_codon:yes stop_codon:yes gene_type:complete
MIERRKPNKVGGGSQTNTNGLSFEGRTHLLDAFDESSLFEVFEIESTKHSRTYSRIIDINDDLIGEYYEKNGIYKYLLDKKGVKWNNVNSKKYLPDGAFYNLMNNTIYIIEKKYQASPGSVDEKLQTCDFKKNIYQKLFKETNIRVEYYYLLNDWFNQDVYNDVFEYIKKVNCKYFIDFIPFEELGL